MKLPKVSRRSFLATVAGAPAGMMLVGSGDAAAQPSCTDRDPSPPRGDPGGRGRNCQNQPPPPPPTGCSDADSGTGSDPGGRGRTCSSRPSTGCSDSDSGSGADPGGRGRRCAAQPPVSGCSDRDPSDPSGRGRNCSGQRDGDAYPTGRRERTYEVCWVDHPSRSDDECNIQTYTEWATTFSDGRTVYDTSEADGRKAEMTRRGYTARWHRILQNW